MSLARYYAALTAAAKPPAPAAPVVPGTRLWYSGDTLTAGGISGWQNQGNTGSTQSLQLGASLKPTCYAGGPAGSNYVRFTGSDFLETPGLLGVSGSAPFTLSFVMRIKDGSGRNFFGMGQQADGKMYDLYIDGERPILHMYGPTGPLTDGGLTAGVWHTFIVSVAATTGYLDGVRSTIQPANPAPNTLRLGAGQWGPLNGGSNVIDIADFRFLDVASSTADINLLRQELTKRYQLPA